jgi:hypothetical protein
MNHWSLGTSLPGLPQLNGDTWWTNPNDGRDGTERSHVTSPSLIATSPYLSITFDSYSSNEQGYPTQYDVEHVQLSINNAPFADVHGVTQDLHRQCDQTFRTITFTTDSSISINVGDSIKYRFLYDTWDGLFGCGSIKGWAFTNVQICGANTTR